eukprot:s2125_g10.t1
MDLAPVPPSVASTPPASSSGVSFDYGKQALFSLGRESTGSRPTVEFAKFEQDKENLRPKKGGRSATVLSQACKATVDSLGCRSEDAMDKDAHLHELYLTHALNSNGISSWGEDFVRSPRITSEQSIRRSAASAVSRFWVTIFLIAIMVGASLYNFHRSQLDFREELRASVRSLAERYAEEISRQIRMSTRSLEALEAAIKIDDAGMTDKHFDELAQSLIGSIMGISALGLAPGGLQGAKIVIIQTTYIDDIVDATGGAPGPPPGASPGQRPDFTFEDRPDFVARRPIFTSYAPVFMPDSWIMLFGQNFSRQCSGTDYPAEVPNCYFPGPPDVHGKATHFWGFPAPQSFNRHFRYRMHFGS